MNIDIQGAKRKLNTLKEKYNQDIGKRDSLTQELQESQAELESLQEYTLVLEQTNVLMQKLAEHQRRRVCQQIEELGTYALQHVFGSKFRMELVLKDGAKPEIEIYVISIEKGVEVKNTPKDSRGGGIVDIVSLALKIVILEIYEPKIDGPIILDEPGKHVSREHIEPLANFLLWVSSKFDRQIILITHNPYLAEIADRRIRVHIKDGKSEINLER